LPSRIYGFNPNECVNERIPTLVDTENLTLELESLIANAFIGVTVGGGGGPPRVTLFRGGDNLISLNKFLRLNLQVELDKRSVGRRRGGGTGDDD